MAPGGGGGRSPPKRLEKYSRTYVRICLVTESSLLFRSCRLPFMSNSHFECFEEILTL